MKRTRVAPSRGLGDTIEKFTKATGIKKVVDTVAKAAGKDFYVSYGANEYPIPFGSTRDVGTGNEEITSSRLNSSTNWDKGGLWSTVINLYSDTSLDKTKRFFTCSTWGIGKIYLYQTKHKSKPWAPYNYTPRVVRFNDLGVSSSAILGVGASVGRAQSDYSVFDLKDINNILKSW